MRGDDGYRISPARAGGQVGGQGVKAAQQRQTHSQRHAKHNQHRNRDEHPWQRPPGMGQGRAGVTQANRPANGRIRQGQQALGQGDLGIAQALAQDPQQQRQQHRPGR